MILAPIDPNIAAQSADADPVRRDMVSRMDMARAKRIPTVAQVNRAIVKAGWTRKKLWTVIEARKSA